MYDINSWGKPYFLSTEIVNQIKDNLSDGTIYDVRRALKKLKLKKYYRNTSYIQSILLDLPLPIVSPNDMVKVGRHFFYGKTVYRTTQILFMNAVPLYATHNHPILDWIIKR